MPLQIGDRVRVKGSWVTGYVTEVSRFDVVVELDQKSEKERAAHGRYVSFLHEDVEVIGG